MIKLKSGMKIQLLKPFEYMKIGQIGYVKPWYRDIRQLIVTFDGPEGSEGWFATVFENSDNESWFKLVNNDGRFISYDHKNKLIKPLTKEKV